MNLAKFWAVPAEEGAKGAVLCVLANEAEIAVDVWRELVEDQRERMIADRDKLTFVHRAERRINRLERQRDRLVARLRECEEHAILLRIVYGVPQENDLPS